MKYDHALNVIMRALLAMSTSGCAVALILCVIRPRIKNRLAFAMSAVLIASAFLTACELGAGGTDNDRNYYVDGFVGANPTHPVPTETPGDAPQPTTPPTDEPWVSPWLPLPGPPADYTAEHMPYGEIPQDYTLENAKADNLVVHENGNITSGQEAWDMFIERVGKGDPCAVRLAFYYTLDDWNVSPELYEEIKDDYPALYIQDLSFDGNTYTLYSVEDGNEHNFRYGHLKKMTEASPPPSATYTKRQMYVLVNDEDATWEKIQSGMLSSQSGDHIDHRVVYSKYTYKG